MNSEWFEKVIKEQIKTCEDVLIGKAKEYATDDDRLHNFKNAAGMMSCDPKEALAGMMAKHTISVYDMCRSGKDYPIELWNEKITDHINYLLLLKAIVEEENSPIEKTKGYLFTDFVKDIWPNYRSQLNNIHDKSKLDVVEDHLLETIESEGEKIVKKLKRMAENSIYGLMETKRDPESKPKTIKLPDGTTPTFDGKPVEIKKQEMFVNKVIKGLTICVDGDCKDCPYNDDWSVSCCNDKLKKDAAELLETYKSIIEYSTSKGKDNTPKIKEDSADLDDAINNLRDRIHQCTHAECESCPHHDLGHLRLTCEQGFLDELNNLIIRLKEANHDNT